MIAAELRFAGAVVPCWPAIYWRMALVECATLRRSARRGGHGKLLAQTLLILLRAGPIADGADTDDKIAAGAGRRGGDSRGCRRSRRCWRDAALHRTGGGNRRALGGSLNRRLAAFQYAAIQGVGAPRKPLLFTGAPTLSSGFSVALLIGRTSVGAVGSLETPAPPSRSGRAGSA